MNFEGLLMKITKATGDSGACSFNEFTIYITKNLYNHVIFSQKLPNLYLWTTLGLQFCKAGT